MDIAVERNRVKHAWLLEAESHHKEKRELALQLPSLETQARESSQAGLETWEYSAKNSLMYYPEAISVQDSDTQPAREIAHRNTRLHGNPYSRALNRNSLQQAAAYQAQFRLGKIGVDGREITQESPQVNGFGYVGTPSPAPGMSESPLVTWGEVEGTPFRVDGPDSPHLDRTPAPAFKMPGPTRRETLGHRMANEASIKHRTRKQEAIRRVTESFVSPSPRPFGGVLSPALQKLMQKTTAGSAPFADVTLRASYTPSPSPRGSHGGVASTGSGGGASARSGGGASARSGGGASARSGGGASARSGGGASARSGGVASPCHVGGAASAASERKGLSGKTVVAYAA
ncbi:splicing factor ESS-2 homolog [Lampetra fluviatilis]